MSLSHANINPDNVLGNTLPVLFYPMCTGFIGIEASVAFSDFVRNYETKFSANDVLNDWQKKKEQINKIGNDKKNDLIEQIVTHTKSNEVTLSEVKNVVEFVKTCSDEMIVNFFNMIMETQKIDNIRKFHKLIGKLVTEIVNLSDKY
jgi:hypothetical protein